MADSVRGRSMTAEKTIRMLINAGYQDGEGPGCSRDYVAEVRLEPIEMSDFSIMELRIIASRGEGEQLLHRLLRGKTDLLIDSIAPVSTLD